MLKGAIAKTKYSAFYANDSCKLEYYFVTRLYIFAYLAVFIDIEMEQYIANQSDFMSRPKSLLEYCTLIKCELPLDHKMRNVQLTQQPCL